MADAYFYPRWSEQEGWCQAGVQTFKIEYYGAIGVDPGREFISRYYDVDIPSGATITAAYVVYTVYVKNGGDAQNFTYDHFYENTVAFGGTVRQDSLPLRVAVAEEDSANRNWTSHASTNQTFTWNNGVGHPDNQDLQVDVTALIQQVFNTNGGRHCALTFKMKIITETGDHGIGNNATGHKMRLLIQYTGGTARNEVVTTNENSDFSLITGTLPTHWTNNAVYGTYQANPTYLTASTVDGLTAPQGGNILKVTATEGGRAVAFHMSPNDLQWGQWYCFSAFAYVPSGVPDVKIVSLQSMYDDNGRMSAKGVWTRIYVPYLVGPDQDPFFGIGTIEAMTIGQSFYLANVNLTKGNHLYPYFDGATTDDVTHHRTFDWGGGTQGQRVGGISYVILDNNPSVTGANPQASASTQKQISVRWDYSDPYVEAQSRYRIEIRKKRVL